jgi:glycosyltransferase involved in cell wall biosynthesis
VTSVVIAAHNEASVIGRCLDALLDADDGELDVVVVANGCTDETAAEAARRAGVRVIELAEASKPAALNAGDAAASGFPRIYLDADIVLSAQSMRALRDALTGGVQRDQRVLAATPCRVLDVAGRPLPVRAFYAINSRLPAYRTALFGRGTVALSAAGRGRFATFPDVLADDLFLDSLFDEAEKAQVDAASVTITTPMRTADLVRRLARVRAGNASLRMHTTDTAQPRRAARWSWLRDVVLPRPWLLPAGACYAALTVQAALAAKRSARRPGNWGRDESSRSALP